MSHPISYAALSHTAVVVDDLDEAVRRYEATFGLRFAPVYRYPGLVIEGEERTPIDVPLTWSIDGPPHLEVIAATPGTMWSCVGQHHVGLWSDDVVVDADRLGRHGFTVEYTYGGPGRPVSGFAYLRDPDGMRVELTSTRFRGAFDRWLAGEPFELR